jgi:hypothetical protein
VSTSITLMRKVLLGVKTTHHKKPDLIIGRWKIFDVGNIFNEVKGVPGKSLNYQIQGDIEEERMLVRIFLDHEFNINETKYYFLNKFDQEIALYLTHSLLIRISNTKKYSINQNHLVKELKF